MGTLRPKYITIWVHGVLGFCHRKRVTHSRTRGEGLQGLAKQPHRPQTLKPFTPGSGDWGLEFRVSGLGHFVAQGFMVFRV